MIFQASEIGRGGGINDEKCSSGYQLNNKMKGFLSQYDGGLMPGQCGHTYKIQTDGFCSFLQRLSR
jgi:hypothetical protein